MWEMELIEATKEEHSIEVVEYGISILMDGIKTISLILGLGLLTGNFKESVLYLFFCIVGTSVMGGYHCKTRIRCLIYTMIGWLIAVYGVNFFSTDISKKNSLIIMMGLLVMVVVLSPAENINKPLSKKTYYINKKKSICFWLGTFVCILITSYLYSSRISLLLIINYIEVVISMLLGKGGNWYVKRKNS